MDKQESLPTAAPTAPIALDSASDIAAGRYDILRRIGAGGMGVVHEAFDRERRQRVALKTLTRFSPAALYTFKREFRALADVVHPNLVHLHELVATGRGPFFTMEFVDGVDFVAYSRAGEDAQGPAGVGRPKTPADIPRLRGALAQLADGIYALHSAGKLHRDIKRSNILVTGDGRVVVLDFGIVADIDAGAEDEIVGTAHYMSPEQAAGDPLTPASDWYSVGVVLYEALTGRLPFVGDPLAVLAQKNIFDPKPPNEWVDGIPADLAALCRELLSSEPERRPIGSEIVNRLAVVSDTLTTDDTVPLAAWPSVSPLIGRQPHLKELRDAFLATRRGRSITVHVRGGSGMGKSALATRFLDALVASGEAIALRGRAYEREAVPFKAFDVAVDALSRYLLRLTRGARLGGAGRSFALPEDIWALARLFPVLRRVPDVAAVADPGMTDLQQVRRRAFDSLRELLSALSRLRPLVIYIDDVQWGDVDSAALLLDLVRQPDAPPVLFILACRDEDAEHSPFVTELDARWPESAEARDVSVGPLTRDDSISLARSLSGSSELSLDSITTIAAEACGSAFLIEELARGASIRRLPAEGGAVTLERMVGHRLGRLPAGARRLLELVAVGGGPITLSIVAHAAALSDAIDPLVDLLRARRFVRAGLREGRETIEVSHDRIREAIVAQLDPATARAHHASLARALETDPGADIEALAEHWIGAGEAQRATTYAEQSAERATAKLAFEQAVRFYRLALGSAGADADRGRLRLRLAESLETAGHGAEAGAEYLLAAKDAPPIQRAELQRAAAEQLLLSGHVDEGAKVLGGVLALWRISVPRTPLSAIVRLLIYRFWLRAVVGLNFEPRATEDVPRETRARIDALYAVSIGLSFVDVIVSACMQSRHLIMALRAGDRHQVMRAASLEASHLAGLGGAETARERDLRAMVHRLAEEGPDAESHRALFRAKDGIRLFLRGHWKESRRVLDEAYAGHRNNRGGSHSNGYLFSLYALVFLGDLVELAQRQAHLLSDAERRGDIYTSVNVRVGYPNIAWLVADDVDAARRNVAEAMAQWSPSGFMVQHWGAMLSEAHIELYVGDGTRAYERVLKDATALKRSRLLKVQFVRAGWSYLRARCAVASTATGSPRQRAARLAEAEALSLSLEREGMLWTAPLASLVRAAVSNARGDAAGASGHLREAIEGASAADMGLFGAAARFALGRLLGREEGRTLEDEARVWMAGQGIRAPERMASLIVPGRFSRQEGPPRG